MRLRDAMYSDQAIKSAEALSLVYKEPRALVSNARGIYIILLSVKSYSKILGGAIYNRHALRNSQSLFYHIDKACLLENRLHGLVLPAYREVARAYLLYHN